MLKTSFIHPWVTYFLPIYCQVTYFQPGLFNFSQVTYYLPGPCFHAHRVTSIQITPDGHFACPEAGGLRVIAFEAVPATSLRVSSDGRRSDTPGADFVAAVLGLSCLLTLMRLFDTVVTDFFGFNSSAAK